MFLDVAFADMKLHLSQKKRSHNERCSLFPEGVDKHDENKINELNQCVT